jgi:hypothetical protein
LRHWKWDPAFWFILGLGTVLRIAWVYFVNTQPVSDFKHYHDLAMSLLRDGRYWLPEGLDYIKQSTPYIQTGVHYPTAFRPPGYPFFLMLVYAIDPSILAAKLANVALSIVGMACTYWLVKRHLGQRVARWATFLTAVFPPAVAYTSILGTEILATTLLLGILCIQAYRVGGRLGRPLMIGFLIGFLSLVKPYFAIFPVLYGLFEWWQNRETLAGSPGAQQGGRGVKPLLLHLICVVLVMAVTIAPWTVRNYLVFHRFVPISTNGDFVLYINNNDRNHGVYMDAMNVPDSIFRTSQILDADGTYNEPDAMRLAKEKALQWIREHPVDFVLLGMDRLSASYFNAGKEIRDWAMDTGTVRFDKKWETPLVEGAQAASLAVAGSGVLYLCLMLYAMIRRKPLAVWHKIQTVLLVFLNLVIFASEGQPRYLFPLYPFFLIGMCWLGEQAYQGLKREREPEHQVASR